ncbi:MAG: hypothetical protein ACREQI_12720 [Candidatus Binataceae bacterium]
MRLNAIAAAALAAAALSGCYASFPAPPPPPPTTVTTWGPLGGFSINTGGCAGQAALRAGAATVSDPCFTGNTNVVLCTDTTAPNPVQCAAAPGSLTVVGTGDDVIAYARLK